MTWTYDDIIIIIKYIDSKEMSRYTLKESIDMYTCLFATPEYNKSSDEHKEVCNNIFNTLKNTYDQYIINNI